jgi:aminoglycoside phosphotransferase (APT) family kinase protein
MLMDADRNARDMLPAGLAARLQQAVGGEIVRIKPRGGGGASRYGAEIDFERDGRVICCYLAYNAARAAAGSAGELGSLNAFSREVAVLRALSGPFSNSGVRVPQFIAADEPTRGILTALAPGEANYNLLTDSEQRRAVSHDFMAQLAALHKVDVKAPEFSALLPDLAASAAIRDRIAALRESKLKRLHDPLIALALNWLEDNVPPDPANNVLVHGDAGPANFLYADGKVTALLDWELTHAGDPHADLAMIAIRNIFQPFIPLKDAFAAYEAAGGVKVDLDRVRYYRVYFQTQFASPPEALNLPGSAPPVFGTSLVYATVHMRVLAQALAEAMGATLESVVLPEAPPGPHARSFEVALDDLKGVIVPRLADQEASAKAKGLARLVKWWRDLERWGPAFERDELRELTSALGASCDSVAQGRALLCERIVARSIDPKIALQLCHAQVSRAAALYADAMGAFAAAGFKPLD